MIDGNPETTGNEEGLFYSIRLLARHPVLSAKAITDGLGMEPDTTWDVGQNGKTSTSWGLTSWTEGQRHFCDEIGDVIEWLEGKVEFMHVFGKTVGAEFHVIVQLDGKQNIGDVLNPALMARAVRLGVSIGLEVFPRMRLPD